MRLPVVIGFGGINAAGRSSAHHAYRRMVIDSLPAGDAERTWQSLAALMNLEYDGSASSRKKLADGTLVRRIEKSHFDVDAIPWNRRVVAHSEGFPMQFRTQRKQLPEELPPGWAVKPLDDRYVHVEIDQGMMFLLPSQQEAQVKAAGQLPSGFDPSDLYQSRNHPRGLQMTVFAASDALGSSGLDWDALRQRIPPDQVSVYAGSGMSQLDDNGYGGMVKARYNGRRVTSKYCPLGFAEMPADFINAYVLGSLGSTGTSMGACASFLYNLRQGIHDIQAGRARIALVGSAEAPITPEIMEGYAAMGALATDKDLRVLDGLGDDSDPDYRRACRPFSSNCGFTIAESAQMVMLCDDELALELGANIYGAVSDVFVNADGHKKSISAPGVGNYITVAKALAAARNIVGDEAIRSGGLVQAHGTGTPQNRVTESHILNEVARRFGIDSWPVVAVKAYLGHSIGCAGADQLTNTLGCWEHGILPGIATIDHVAEDVHSSHLDIAPGHREIVPGASWAVINAKGFGGNNASATLLAPAQTQKMLAKRHGKDALLAWERQHESVAERSAAFDDAMVAGDCRPVYRFDHGVLGAEDVALEENGLKLGDLAISLQLDNPYRDMC